MSSIFFMISDVEYTVEHYFRAIPEILKHINNHDQENPSFWRQQ